MSDIRLNVGFLNHPKTVKLQRRAGPESVLCLLRLWCWARTNRPDGNLDGLDAEDVAIVAGDNSADPEALVSHLVGVGYLDETPAGYRLHDWETNQPWAAGSTERSNRARNAAKARWQRGPNAKGKPAGNATGKPPRNATGTKQQSPSLSLSKDSPQTPPFKPAKPGDAWRALYELAKTKGRNAPSSWDEPTKRALRAVGGFAAVCGATHKEIPRLRSAFIDAYRTG